MKFTTLTALVAIAAAADCDHADVTKAKKDLKALQDELDVIKKAEGYNADAKSDRQKALEKTGEKSADYGLIQAAEKEVTFQQNAKCVATNAGGAEKKEEVPDAAEDEVPEEDVPSGDAESDIAKGLVTKAAQEIEKFEKMIENGERDAYKSADGKTYAQLSASEQEVIDAQLKLNAKARSDHLTNEKKDVKYDELTEAQKRVYLKKYNDWRVEFQGACDTDKDSDACKYGNELRAKQVSKQVADAYYKKAEAEQTKDDDKWKLQKKLDLASIEAADKKGATNGIKVAALAACKKDQDGTRPVCPADHCCGYAKKKADDAVGGVTSGINAIGGIFNFSIGPKGDEICAPSAGQTVERTIDGKKETHTFKCIVGAAGLVSTVATVVAATFMMA